MTKDGGGGGEMAWSEKCFARRDLFRLFRMFGKLVNHFCNTGAKATACAGARTRKLDGIAHVT